MAKDWTGNTKSVYTMIGAKGHTDSERETHDFYATEGKAIELLLDVEEINHNVWENACGTGNLSKILEERGYNVRNSDIIDRGYPHTQVIDFLKYQGKFNGDIITNPPFKFAKEFVEHSLDIVEDGCKVCMFLKLTFLEGKERKEMFKKFPPKRIYVSSSRLRCAKNNDFDLAGSSAVCYAWFVWVKGDYSDPIIKWIN